MKGSRKALMIVGIISVVLLILIAIISGTDTETTETEVIAQIEEVGYELPSEDVFVKYLMDRFNSLVDDLELDTILIEPVELEVREYKLNSRSRPDIALTAYIKETPLALRASDISGVMVLITLEWLAEQGFNPHNEWIMPICSIMRRETGATGEAMMRVLWKEYL